MHGEREKDRERERDRERKRERKRERTREREVAHQRRVQVDEALYMLQIPNEGGERAAAVRHRGVRTENLVERMGEGATREQSEKIDEEKQNERGNMK